MAGKIKEWIRKRRANSTKARLYELEHMVEDLQTRIGQLEEQVLDKESAVEKEEEKPFLKKWLQAR